MTLFVQKRPSADVPTGSGRCNFEYHYALTIGVIVQLVNFYSIMSGLDYGFII